jgi:hypothetical protein
LQDVTDSSLAILTQELFTDKGDVVVSVGGWSLDVGQTVDALAGNDTVNALKGGASAEMELRIPAPVMALM